MRYVDISYLVISHGMGYHINICPMYHAISHMIPPKHHEKQFQREPTILFRSTICFWFLVSARFLACLPSGLSCGPSVVHELDTS